MKLENLSFASIFFLEEKERKRGSEREEEKEREREREREEKKRKGANEREEEVDRANDIFASKAGSFLEETQRSS